MSLVTTPCAADAEACASVAEYDAYLAARGIANTTATSDKENALRSGWSSLENLYRDRWVGITVTQTQALAWPRVDGTRGDQTGRGFGYGWTFPLFDINGWQIPTDSIPQQIKNANIEAARLVIAGVTLEPTLVRGGQIKSIGKSVGPLRKDIVYMDGAPATDRYLVIEGILRGLVTSTPGSPSGNTKLVRA